MVAKFSELALGDAFFVSFTAFFLLSCALNRIQRATPVYQVRSGLGRELALGLGSFADPALRTMLRNLG
jgi:hypothetical protein